MTYTNSHSKISILAKFWSLPGPMRLPLSFFFFPFFVFVTLFFLGETVHEWGRRAEEEGDRET